MPVWRTRVTSAGLLSSTSVPALYIPLDGRIQRTDSCSLSGGKDSSGESLVTGLINVVFTCVARTLITSPDSEFFWITARASVGCTTIPRHQRKPPVSHVPDSTQPLLKGCVGCHHALVVVCGGDKHLQPGKSGPSDTAPAPHTTAVVDNPPDGNERT